MNYYKIWCEWDIGEEDNIYETEADAWAAIDKNPNVAQACHYNHLSIDEMIAEGLISLTPITLKKRKKA